MKSKLIIIAAIAMLSFSFGAQAQAVDVNAQYQATLIQLIELLKQQVIVLQAQLAALEQANIVASSTVPQMVVPQIVPPPTAPSIETVPAIAPAVTAAAPATPAIKTISVSFATSTDGHAYVTVKNDTGVRVRVVNLDVSGGTLGLFSFSDSPYEYGSVLSCTGLGSKGKVSAYGGPIDPCKRPDANLAINEIEPGETMTLRYQGGIVDHAVQPISPDATLIYHPGSIVETATGNDVQYTVTALAPIVLVPFVHHISVKFATTTDSEAFVTVDNTTIGTPVGRGNAGEYIRIKNLIVPGGTLASSCVLGYCDPQVASDWVKCQQGQFEMAQCIVTIPAAGTAILRYVGTPTGVTYDPMSIEGTWTGYDIQF